MMAPVFLSALSVAELQAQVNALLQKIQSVNVAATSQTVAPAKQKVVTCPRLTRVLTLGSIDRDTNADVSLLQTFLKEQGFYQGDAYGIFDAPTL
ncbi:MAG: hypothetical protein ABL860_03075, partial [Candidatus Nitrotoga sp.]